MLNIRADWRLRIFYLKVVMTVKGRCSAVVLRLTRNVEVVGSSPNKAPRCFIEQETLPLLLSTGWFQERIQR